MVCVCVLYLCDLQVGAATAIGEQPIKALLDPEAGARLSVAEAITNLVFAPVTSLRVRPPPPSRSRYLRQSCPHHSRPR